MALFAFPLRGQKVTPAVLTGYAGVMCSIRGHAILDYKIVRLNKKNTGLYHSLNDLFGEVFNEHDTYTKNRPDNGYINSLLSDNSFIALVAVEGAFVIGGLVAYELKKFEQRRSEIYIYDLAVSEVHRRKGIATSLIEQLNPIAQSLGAWVIFVQADYTDEPAVSLYNKLGEQEEVLHFDIPVSTKFINT